MFILIIPNIHFVCIIFVCCIFVDSSEDLSDMDRLLQKVADRCNEPVVLETIYNYYSTSTVKNSQQTV